MASLKKLKAEAHDLADEVFDYNRTRFYCWLKGNFNKSHISEMNHEELMACIKRLAKIKLKGMVR